MATTRRLDSERAAKVIAAADQFGIEKAARLFGISPRTVERYRARLEFDPELSGLVDNKRQELLAKTKHWAEEADEFMSEALQVMRQKLPKAELRDVVGAYKIVGELTLTRQALQIDDDEPPRDPESPEAEEDPG
jgi:predicted HAD superfamily phosphohydrolase